VWTLRAPSLAVVRIGNAAGRATMKEFACQYAFLRFRPFAETGEFANVGVVLMAAEAGFFDFRLLKRYGRITQFFYPFDREVYLNGRELFKEELQRFASELRSDALDGAAGERRICFWRASASPNWFALATPCSTSTSSGSFSPPTLKPSSMPSTTTTASAIS
jgi:hypothetical protein